MKKTDFKSEFLFIRDLLKRLGVLLFLYTLLRFAFLYFNREIFSEASGYEIFIGLLAGIRFDISAIIYSNLLFILLYILPINWRSAVVYQASLKVLYVLVNAFTLAIAVADLVYFQFNKKRISVDMFSMMESFGSQWLQFLRDYWYLFLIYGLLLCVLIRCYPQAKTNGNSGRPSFLMQLMLFLVSGISFFVLARGGLQNRPITPAQAARDAGPKTAVLATNSPFTFIYSIQKRKLKERVFMDEALCDQLFTPYQEMHHDSMTKKNVVIIILESFSREYIGALNKHSGYTPFLDSLISSSLVFNNAFANGERSNKALPAILAGIPSLMDDPLMYSAYQANCVQGIGTLLKGKGYTTSFFHGGLNGEFNFDAFARAAGFDHYYGKNEFNDDRFFDGHWGIYDEEFLQYFSKKLDDTQEPFCSAVFTVSSHHPFTIPARLQGKFPKGETEIQESIYYTDYALMKFFERAAQTEWFANTLFVITSDHTFQYGKRLSQEYENRAMYFSIPILFYDPGMKLKGMYSEVFQQTDILPTVLEVLRYDGSFVSFGRSAFEKQEDRAAVQFLDGIYQIVDNEFCLLHDGNRPLSMFRYKADVHFSADVLSQETVAAKKLQEKLEAYIQQYSRAMIRNEFCAKR